MSNYSQVIYTLPKVLKYMQQKRGQTEIMSEANALHPTTANSHTKRHGSKEIDASRGVYESVPYVSFDV
jgi:hypothetical protein